MNQQYDPSIHLNTYGEPDREYYVAEAQRLCRRAASEIATCPVRWLFNRLSLPLAMHGDSICKQ